MQNIDCIKRYQLSFLEKWNGEDYEEVRRILFSELAGWHFLHARSCFSIFGETRTKQVIEQALMLPAFIAAREYYNTHQSLISSQGAKLLLNGDPDAYIEAIRKMPNSVSWKDHLRNALKKIIYKL